MLPEEKPPAIKPLQVISQVEVKSGTLGPGSVPPGQLFVPKPVPGTKVVEVMSCVDVEVDVVVDAARVVEMTITVPGVLNVTSRVDSGN